MQTDQAHKRRHARHLAYQIIAQLPEETEEAVMVLEYAKRLLLQEIDEKDVATLKLVEKT